MTDQTNEVSLEEVRVRFMDAEARLSDAATAVGGIQDAAERLGAAREGLTVAGLRLGELAGSMDEVASSLSENAAHLREGVDAIRAGDPAQIRRQIEELDAAFTAMQAVVGERLTKLEAHAESISQGIGKVDGQTASLMAQLNAISAANEVMSAKSRRETLVIFAAIGALLIVLIVLALVR